MFQWERSKWSAGRLLAVSELPQAVSIKAAAADIKSEWFMMFPYGGLFKRP